MKKIICIGTKELHSGLGRVYCKITIKDGELSISGIEGPLASGNAKGGWGQIQGHLYPIKTFEPGWSIELLDEFIQIWNAWHLNDMQAGCEHQRAEGWGDEKISTVKVVAYDFVAVGQTSHGRIKRQLKVIEVARARAQELGKPINVGKIAPANRDHIVSRIYLKALDAARNGELYQPATDNEATWIGPDKVIRITEQGSQYAGQVYEADHPKGVLAKPCPTCGYEYGTAWLKEELPAEVISFLESLPDSEYKPAWV